MNAKEIKLVGDGVELTHVFAEELKEQVLGRLKGGIAHFVFEKLNGQLREAYGTLTPELMPSRKANLTDRMFDILEGIAEGTEETEKSLQDINALVLSVKLGDSKPPREPSETNQPYYDLEAQAWRSYNPNNLIALL